MSKVARAARILILVVLLCSIVYYGYSKMGNIRLPVQNAFQSKQSANNLEEQLLKALTNVDSKVKQLKSAREELDAVKSKAASIKQGFKRLAILQIHTPPFYKTWANITIDNKRKYVQKHGYGLYVEHGKLDPRHPVWSKIAALLRHMEEDRHEWFWALDLDTLIMNGDKKATDLLDDDFDMIINRDCNWFNAGSFMIKNSEWSKNYLRQGLL